MKSKISMLAMVAMMALATSSFASSVGINFIGGRTNGSGPTPLGSSPTATAFGIDAADWNNIGDRANPSGGPVNVTSTNGEVLQVTWQSNNTWTLDGANPVPAGDAEVFQGYLDDGGPDFQPNITIGGFDAVDGLQDYSITVLLSSSDGTAGNFENTQILVTDPALGTFTFSGPIATAPPWAPGTNDRIGSVTLPFPNFAVGILPNELNIRTVNGANRGSIAGIVINMTIIPEPASAVLLGMAGLGLIRRRRAA